MTTFRGLTVREETILEAFGLWLDSLADFINLLGDQMWNETTAAADIHPWVRKASVRLSKTYLAPVTATLSEVKLDPRRAGFAESLMKWADRSGQEVVAIPELKRAQKRHRISPRLRRKLGKKWAAFTLNVGVTKNELQRSKFIPQRAERYVNRLERDGSLQELQELRDGQAEGLKGIGQNAPRDRSDLSTRILFALVTWWRLVVRFKSVSQLHEWLVAIFGRDVVRDQKRVEKICQRIGLKFREVGRPRKIPTPVPSG